MWSKGKFTAQKYLSLPETNFFVFGYKKEYEKKYWQPKETAIVRPPPFPVLDRAIEEICNSCC